MLNPYFLNNSKQEQNLIQSLVNEQLQMYGIEIFYIPRRYVKKNTVIREVIQSEFDNAYPIEAYLDSYEGYGGQGTLLSKFGIQEVDDLTLVVSRERYENYITPLIQGQANIKLSTRPKGGDLIWFPLDDRLYEIKDIEYAKPYYQLQGLYVYELYCELFRYQDEVIATGIDDIDNELLGDEADGLTDDGISTIQGITQTLTMVGTAVNATAVVGLVDGGVRSFTITNRGGGYGMVPDVQISSAPAGGLTAVGIASMIGGIQVCNLNANPRLQSVQRVDISNTGFGYTVAPTVTFSTTDGTGSGAAATTIIGDDVVGIVTITNAGGGYIDNPVVSFTNEIFKSGITTAGATALAFVSAAGTVANVFLTNSGLGYSVAPNISIAAPDSGTNIGEFVFNEIITGSTSGTTARVRSWNSTTNALEVASPTGSFSTGETITGASSGAIRTLRSIDKTISNDPYADNFDIETEANKILDFTEQNPFGTP